MRTAGRLTNRSKPRASRLRYSTAGLALALTFVVLSVDSVAAQARDFIVDEDPTAPPAADTVDPDGIPEDQRDAALGSSWSDDGDTISVVLGGSEGLAVLSAKSKDGYAWHEVTTLPATDDGTDLWISNSCVTSSGQYMIVVYGPRSITNSEDGFDFGATAVIVDLRSQKVRELGTGYSIAYHNPGCGEGDTFTLSGRAPGTADTLVASLDAASGEVLVKATLEGQATSAVSDAKGSIYVAAAAGILRITSSGKPETVIKTKGLTYDLSVDDAGRLAYVTHDGELTAAWVAPLEGKVKPKQIATGPLTEIGIRRAGSGGFYLLGESVKMLTEDSGVTPLPEASLGSVISSTGSLVVQGVKPAGIAPAGEPDEVISEDALRARIDAAATNTDQLLSFDLGNYEPLSNPEAIELEEPIVGGGRSTTAASLALGDPHDPSESERYCSVPRNDPNSQAYQPKPRQVEWAVDRAVKGQLVESRPANWRNLGMAAYTPQGMFPRTTLNGGGTIPPQIVLGVLMQESNMWQASRYTAPGNTGNPLIGDYYGNEINVWDISWSDADCGYGVGQITDGMRTAAHARPGEVTLPADQQRAIALDYAANIAKTVQMLGQKWNQLRSLGITVHNGSASSIENWFAAVWAYNTGLQPSSAYYGNGTGCSPSPTCTTPYGTWGLGWLNNPANTSYPPGRDPFLNNDHAVDAANPQLWPYPEKVLGFAAWGLTLVETQWANVGTRTYPTKVVSSYSLSWWNSNYFRETVKPPLFAFCFSGINGCDSMATQPCTVANLWCYWHDNAGWKDCASGECGYGNERFSYPTYASEASSILSSLPADTRQMSFPPNCAASDPAPYVSGRAAPPPGALIVDDTPHAPVRLDCTQQPRQGTFQFTFYSPTGGSYPGKKDVHQLGGGYNAHFYFSHMRSDNDPDANLNNRLKVTGTWTLNQDLHQWTRVWVHLPDHGGWTDQAGYHITDGNGVDQTRYLPQRRYQNSWVSLGVFEMDGTPSVSLSNIARGDVSNANYDDIAWDAVAFQPLSAKPADFVVGLGDSFSSGEGAGSYAAWSDHGGNSTGGIERNGCHQSTNAWIMQTRLPGDFDSIAARLNSASLDFHFLACSGAETENLLPYYSYNGPGTPPANGNDETGNDGQYSTVSQLDAGYLDENTTLVTFSIGGNDIRFADIIPACALATATLCDEGTFLFEFENVGAATEDRLANEVPWSLTQVIDAIQAKAPNAVIVLMGYPRLFDTGYSCVLGMSEQPWLNEMSDELRDTMAAAAAAQDSPTQRVLYVDPQPYFQGQTLCVYPSGVNGIVGTWTPGDEPFGLGWPGSTFVSQQSVHPNVGGNLMYRIALETALVGVYP